MCDVALVYCANICAHQSHGRQPANRHPTPQQPVGLENMALHQEDAYFDRLSGGPNGEVHASPYVQVTAARDVAPLSLDEFLAHFAFLFAPHLPLHIVFLVDE